MCKWLMETTDSYGTKLQQRPDKMFNILQSTIILLVVIHRLNLLVYDECNYFLKCLEEKHYQVLFQGLCTIPDWKNNPEDWPDFRSIEELLFKFDKKIKTDIVDVLISMYMKASHFKQSMPEVLFSFPIFHFAKGVWKPFKDATKLQTFNSEINGAFHYFKETATKW